MSKQPNSTTSLYASCLCQIIPREPATADHTAMTSSSIDNSKSVVVISPSEPYRLALVALLAAQGLCPVTPGHQGPTEAALCYPYLDPRIVIVDASAVENVIEARKTWPKALIICLLDYIGDRDFMKSLGADGCALKDRGVPAILEAIAHIADSSGSDA